MSPPRLAAASLAAALLLAAPAIGAPASQPTAPPALGSPKAEAGYAVGFNVGSQMRAAGLPEDAETEALMRGLRDGLAGQPSMLSDAQIRAAMVRLQGSMSQRHEAMAARASVENRAKGLAFLKANGAKKGVVTLPDGLQYEVLKVGSGPRPKASDTVVVNYRGTLIDGTEFDSSYARGQAAEFPVGRVIRGWTEALQLMPVGSKWRLVLPADLAYGDKGAGGRYPPARSWCSKSSFFRPSRPDLPLRLAKEPMEPRPPRAVSRSRTRRREAARRKGGASKRGTTGVAGTEAADLLRDGRAAAAEAGLIYFSPDRPGIHRRRSGRGFAYRAPGGADDRERRDIGRIRSLVDPTGLARCLDLSRPEGHIQAWGYDVAGRKQYRYHPEFRLRREERQIPSHHRLRSRLSNSAPRSRPPPAGPGSAATRCWRPWSICWRPR